MKRILPPSRPKRDNAMLDAVLEHYACDETKANLIFVRGYYLDSMGVRGQDDDNIYDDAAFLVTPNIRDSWNANTGPSFVTQNRQDLAKLNLGLYLYYRGRHKNRIAAFRPYPEGVVWKCTRNGKPSTCSTTNIHDGGANPAAFDVVWSRGCMTVPKTQYHDFQTRVYSEMDRCPQATGTDGKKLIDVVLVENRQTPHGQQLFDENGRVI